MEQPMRLALLSDVHGNLPALEAVLHELDREPVDLVVNLGDILSGPLWPRETAERLMALGLPTLAGNHERQILTHPRDRMGATDAFAAARLGDRHRAWLASLPPTLRPAPGLLCCHGTPTTDLVYLLETPGPGEVRGGFPGIRAAREAEVRERLGAPAAALVACGHSHVARALQVDGTLVVNPGSVGLQAFADEHLHRHMVESGSPPARYARVEGGPGGWRVQLRLVPYDHEAAARRAEEGGRPDWALALRTGFAARPEAWGA
jgi:predicted phosphodiesterase